MADLRREAQTVLSQYTDEAVASLTGSDYVLETTRVGFSQETGIRGTDGELDVDEPHRGDRHRRGDERAELGIHPEKAVTQVPGAFSEAVPSKAPAGARRGEGWPPRRTPFPASVRE